MLRTRVNFQGSGVVGPSVSTMHWLGSTSTDAQNTVDALAEFWEHILAGVCGNQLEAHISPEVEIIDPASGQITGVHGVDPESIDPAPAGAIASPATQMLATWLTPTFANGRQRKGQTFIPSIIRTAMSNDGSPTTAARSAVAVGMDALVNWPAVSLVVYSPTHRDHSTVTGIGVGLKFAVLRSRRD